MKTLSKLITESLVTEGKTKNVVLAFPHDDPEIDFLVKDPTPKQMKWLSDHDFCMTSLQNPTNIIVLQHSDEDPCMWNAVQTEAQLKSEAFKSIKASLDNFKVEYQNDPEHADDDNWWCDWEFEGWWGCFNMNPLEFNTPEKVYKSILQTISESYIDNDSYWVWSVVDLNNDKEIVGGDHSLSIFSSYDFDEWINYHYNEID